MLKKLAVLTISTLLLNIQAVNAADKVWIIKQIVDQDGKRTVCVSKNGIKFVQDEYVLFSKAPDWNIVLLNKKLKNFYKTSLVGINGVSWIEKLPGPVEEKAGKSSVLAGLKTKLYKGYSAEKKLLVKISKDLPMDGEKLELVKSLYGAQAVDGLPLEVTVLNGDKDARKMLVTDWSMSKELPGSFYNIPRGYMAAKKMSEVQIPNSKGKERVRKYKPFQKKRNRIK